MRKFYQLDPFGDASDTTLALIEDYVIGQEMFDWRTGHGHAASDSWPEDATIVLRKSSGRKLTDILRTITNTLYVSSKLRAVFERHCQDMAIEYLPFTLRDFRGRVLSEDYSIINALGTLDVIDTKSSRISWDDEDPSEVLNVWKIVLSAEKLDELSRIPALFRVKEDPATYIITYDLAKEIHDGDFAGVFWEKLEVI